METTKFLVASIIVGIVGGLASAVSTFVTHYEEMSSSDVALMFTAGVLTKAVMYFIYAAIAYPLIKVLFKRMGW